MRTSAELWDNCSGYSAGMEGYTFFRKDTGEIRRVITF